MELILIFICSIFISCDGITSNTSAGKPLFLTSLIENNKLIEARKAAKVHIKELPSIKSYSGFFTVNKQYNSNMFFWFFPASEIDYKKVPLVLWLQGGPGSSSLFGLFNENGPISTDKNGKPQLRQPYNWNKKHSMIYIDNPVGTGFSFTEDSTGYARNQTNVAINLYETLQQFFVLFPELQNNEFYVSGESYAGKYIPAISYKIHQENPAALIKINLKGLLIGNGYCDPVNQLDYDEYSYQIGLIDLKTKLKAHGIQEKIIKLIHQKEWIKAFELQDTLLSGDIIGIKKTMFHYATGYTNYFNYLNPHEDLISASGMQKFLQKNDTRRASHVGNLPFQKNLIVEEYLKEDYLQSVAPWISELLSHYRILFYNGQLDIIVAYPLTLKFLQNLKFDGDDVYKIVDRHRWYVDGELAGYFKEAGNLTEVLVRNAGHIVPQDQPKWAYDLFYNFVNNKSLKTT